MDLSVMKNPAVMNIVNKLQHLDCTLLGSGEEWWLYELLFTPGMHRFQLLEWMLGKLNVDLPKLSQPHNSPDERAKNLLSTLTDLGFCRSTDNDLILGKAARLSQVLFWRKLLDILWEKAKTCSELLLLRGSERELFSESESEIMLEQFYNDCCFKISSVAHYLNRNELFFEKNELLPVDIVKDIENTFQSGMESKEVSLENLKANLGDTLSRNHKASNTEWIRGNVDLSELSSDVFTDVDPSTDTVKKISSVTKHVCGITEEFDQLYSNNVKPVLKPRSVSDSTISKDFNDLYMFQKSLSESLSNLSVAKSCYHKFNQLAGSLPVNSTEDKIGTFSCSVLRDYADVIQGTSIDNPDV